MNRSAILLFESKLDYFVFNTRAFIDRSTSRNLTFFVFIDTFRGNPSELNFDSKQPALTTSRLFRNENFLYFDTKDSLRLITFTTFQQPLCRSWKIVELNRFKRGQKASEGKFVEKFQTFNGCRMKIKIPVPQPKVLDYDYASNSYHGYGVVFNEVISMSLNYTFIFVRYSQSDSKIDEIPEDFEISADSMRKVIITRNTTICTTRSYTVVDEIFLISRPHAYTQFEKVFLPFEHEVWWWLIATFSVALVVICVVKLLPQSIHELVFGKKINTPIINLM
jgi:hypothetical protein